jgi:hypothetical protein
MYPYCTNLLSEQIHFWNSFNWFWLEKLLLPLTINALKNNNFAHFSVQVTVSDNVKRVVLHIFRGFCLQLGMNHITTMPCYWHAPYMERLNWKLRPALIVYHLTSQTSWFGCSWHLTLPPAEAMWATSFKIIFLFQADSLLLNIHTCIFSSWYQYYQYYHVVWTSSARRFL